MAFLNLRRKGKDACNAEPATPGLNGEVVALDARTGKLRWRRVIGAERDLAARRRPDASTSATGHGAVYALDAKTGRTVWTLPHRRRGEGSASRCSGRRLYVGSYDHHLYALNARTGALIWRASAQDRLGGRGTFYSTPAAAYGRVYIGSTDGKVYSFGATSGELRWSQSTGGYVYALARGLERARPVGSYSGASTRSTPPPATSGGSSRRTGRSRARRRVIGTSSTSRR